MLSADKSFANIVVIFCTREFPWQIKLMLMNEVYVCSCNKFCEGCCVCNKRCEYRFFLHFVEKMINWSVINNGISQLVYIRHILDSK